jgi:hypothetical protein
MERERKRKNLSDFYAHFASGEPRIGRHAVITMNRSCFVFIGLIQFFFLLRIQYSRLFFFEKNSMSEHPLSLLG